MTPPPPKKVYLTRAQVREVDRIAIERYHIPGIVLMENAARAAAGEAVRLARDTSADPGDFSPGHVRALILCGGGNNGGDGLAVARWLHVLGCGVGIGLTVDPQRYKGDAKTNWEIIEGMNLPTFEATPTGIAAVGATIVVDAIFGTGLDRPPRDPFAQLAAAIEAKRLPVLSVDLPSGMDCDTGRPAGPACVRASRTVTFVAEKAGFALPESRAYTGGVTVAPIGCPDEIVAEILA